MPSIRKLNSLDHSFTAFKCPLCGTPVHMLTHAHMDGHGTTKVQFLRQYPQYANEAYWGQLPGYVIKAIGAKYRRRGY